MDGHCISVNVHEGTPYGKVETINGRATYVSAPPKSNSKSCLVILHDGFGYELVNNRLLSDAFAQGIGCTLYLPDFFEGTAYEPGKYELEDFLKSNSKEVRWPQIKDYVTALKKEHGYEKVGAIGYCWGGWGTWKLAGLDGAIDACAVAHPSLIEADDAKVINVPALIICAEMDSQLTDEKREKIQKVMVEKAKSGLYSKLAYYPGTAHGFAVRGDLSNPLVLRALESARDDAVSFFKTFLG